MYITKISIDMTRSKNCLGFVDAGYFHKVLEGSFDGEREHPLWNLTGNEILMVSNRAPDVPAWFGKSVTKPYAPDISDGTVLKFKITANPIVKRKGKRVPLNINRTVAQSYCATDWLRDKMLANGAAVLDVDVREHKTVKAKEGKVKFFAVTYEGALVVKDNQKFQNLLASGIGYEKAYGCGLLLVRR